MRSCKDCFWFSNKFEVGVEGNKSKYSCLELATKPTDSPCGDFTKDGSYNKKNEEFIFSSAFQDLMKKESESPSSSEVENPFDISQLRNLFEIVTDIFKIEQDTHLVIQAIKNEVERQGFEIPFNANLVKGFSSKLTDLYLLYRMSLSMGMGNYVDEIIKLRIEKLFTDPNKYKQGQIIIANADKKGKNSE